MDLIEIKLSQTVNEDYFKGIRAFPSEKHMRLRYHVIYNGETGRKQQGVNILSWQSLPGLVEEFI